MNKVAQTYTQLSIEGSSPVGLVVALYDNALRSLHRARRAMDENDIERRTQYLNHVLCIIAHLQGTLDLENGGEVAESLLKFYSFARASVLEVSISNSKEKLSTLASHFSSLRDAWQVVDSQAIESLRSVAGMS